MWQCQQRTYVIPTAYGFCLNKGILVQPAMEGIHDPSQSDLQTHCHYWERPLHAKQKQRH